MNDQLYISALDLWQATIPLVADPASHFGQDGRYLYRYQLQRADGSEVAFWFADPFGFDAWLDDWGYDEQQEKPYQSKSKPSI